MNLTQAEAVTPIEALALKPHTIRLLKENGCQYAEDLTYDIIHFKGIGANTITEIANALRILKGEHTQ